MAQAFRRGSRATRPNSSRSPQKLCFDRARWIAGCPRCSHDLLRSATRAGFTPDIRHRTDDYVVVQSMVAAGAAVSVLPELALAASRHPAVRVVPLDHDPYRTVTASVTSTTAGVPAAAALLDHLRAAAAAVVAFVNPA